MLYYNVTAIVLWQMVSHMSLLQSILCEGANGCDGVNMFVNVSDNNVCIS